MESIIRDEEEMKNFESKIGVVANLREVLTLKEQIVKKVDKEELVTDEF